MSELLKDRNDGQYAVLEGNFLSAKKTGQIKAQLPLSDDFTKNEPAENGMCLVYDRIAGEVRTPEGTEGPEGDLTDERVLLHFSVEKLYDSQRPELASFAVKPGDVYPRLYQLNVGDTFTTDAVLIDSGLDIEDLDTYEGRIVGVNNEGWIDATQEVDNYDDIIVKFRVIEATDLPGADFGVNYYGLKFEVVSA